MTKISILGCGWLGFPLAKALLENGFSVNGSTTSTEKLLNIENAGISSFLIELGEVAIKGNISEFLEGSQGLIIDIPPKLRGAATENFVAKIKNLIP
ncbi:MAG: SDR family NAD(P)-dependent oxidoreductase, partial [Flavobacteriaceae bacterium]|nr:SDR family NAD(P)-dependent oxidoreductase [Flavobacteriaceae bacterium]